MTGHRNGREEPVVGAVDMASVEFRRPRRRVSRPESEERHAGLWWQIALGVFTGLLAHSVVTGLYVRVELYMGLKAAGEALDQLAGDLTESAPPPVRPAQRASTRRAAPSAAPRPLGADERCVGGKRFRRVENGWVQVLEACS